MFRYEMVATNSARFDIWRQLRTDLYLEADLIAPDDLGPTGLYVDEYDAYSIHVLALDDDGAPVGCCRLIEGNLGPLQVVHQFDINPTAPAFEVSGCAVVASQRSSYASLGLYRAMYALGTELGYEYAYMEVERWFLATLVDLGLPLRPVGELRYVFNSLNMVGQLAMSEVVPSLAAADRDRGGTTRFGDYFHRTFTWSLSSDDLFVAPAPESVPDVV